MTDEIERSSLPDTNFVATLSDRRVRLRSIRAFSRAEGTFDLIDEALERTPLRSASWSMVQYYMLRRFGPANHHGDNDKDLCARWILTTTDSEVMVMVSPSIGRPYFIFRPYATEALSDRADKDLTQIQEAYRTTCLDLLRPVRERDVWFNVMGVVRDGDRLLAFDDDTESHVFAVSPHGSCGKPVPLGLMEDDRWGRLCSILEVLGDDRAAAGLDTLIAGAASSVIARAAKETHDFRVILAGFLIDAGRSEEASLVRPSAVREDGCLRVVEALRWATALVTDLTGEDVVRLSRVLHALGFDEDIHAALDNCRFSYRLYEAWERAGTLVETLPDELLSSSSDLSSMDRDASDVFVRRIRSKGFLDLANWIDKKETDEDRAIVSFVFGHARKRREYKRTDDRAHGAAGYSG